MAKKSAAKKARFTLQGFSDYLLRKSLDGALGKKAVAPAPIWKRKAGQHTAIIGDTCFLIEKRKSNMGGAIVWAIFGSNGYQSWASLLRIAKPIAEKSSAPNHKSPDACGVYFGEPPPASFWIACRALTPSENQS